MWQKVWSGSSRRMLKRCCKARFERAASNDDQVYRGRERFFFILRPFRQIFFSAVFLNICGNGIKQPIRGVFILTIGMLFLQWLNYLKLWRRKHPSMSISANPFDISVVYAYFRGRKRTGSL